MGKMIWLEDRKTDYIEPQKKFYIFCEGKKTEPLYFELFKDLIEMQVVYKGAITVVPCGANTMTVLNMAKKYVKKNDISSGEIWCVYDKDSFTKEKFNQVALSIKDLNKKMKGEMQYYAGWSNECIEFWFLLYFDYCDVNNGRKACVKKLNKIYRDFGNEKSKDNSKEASKKGIRKRTANKKQTKSVTCTKYEKNNKQVFTVLREKGNEIQAIQYAKKLMKGTGGKQPSDIAPGTRVHELVEKLRMYLPKSGW